MSVLDFFKAGKTEPAATNTSPNNNPETSTPPVAKDPNDLRKDTENPLDTYAKMFENASKNSDIQAPSFSIDQKILSEVSGKMDFMQHVSPELMQKATGGDVAALMQIMNEVGRGSYKAALDHTTKLTDTYLGQRTEFDTQRLSKGVKQQLTSNALSDNANYNHPVIKAELNRIASDFARSPEFADASPKQIAEAAKKYLDDLHSAMNPVDQTKTSSGKPKPKEIDYMKYITGEG